MLENVVIKWVKSGPSIFNSFMGITDKNIVLI